MPVQGKHAFCPVAGHTYRLQLSSMRMRVRLGKSWLWRTALRSGCSFAPAQTRMLDCCSYVPFDTFLWPIAMITGCNSLLWPTATATGCSAQSNLEPGPSALFKMVAWRRHCAYPQRRRQATILYTVRLGLVRGYQRHNLNACNSLIKICVTSQSMGNYSSPHPQPVHDVHKAL